MAEAPSGGLGRPWTGVPSLLCGSLSRRGTTSSQRKLSAFAGEPEAWRAVSLAEAHDTEAEGCVGWRRGRAEAVGLRGESVLAFLFACTAAREAHAKSSGNLRAFVGEPVEAWRTVFVAEPH